MARPLYHLPTSQTRKCRQWIIYDHGSYTKRTIGVAIKHDDGPSHMPLCDYTPGNTSQPFHFYDYQSSEQGSNWIASINRSWSDYAMSREVVCMPVVQSRVAVPIHPQRFSVRPASRVQQARHVREKSRYRLREGREASQNERLHSRACPRDQYCMYRWFKIYPLFGAAKLILFLHTSTISSAFDNL